MKSMIGVAVLGAGRIGQEHARNLLGIPNVRVAAIADPIQAARDAAQTLTRASVSVRVDHKIKPWTPKLLFEVASGIHFHHSKDVNPATRGTIKP
jgi:glyceraldehyde-3-phosphate dehydrogenase/erythrose-4-phosphate dehydrogenase